MRRFLEAAYYMLVEDARSLPGFTLMSAVDLVSKPLQMPSSEKDEQNVEIQNSASINELNALMAGVQKK